MKDYRVLLQKVKKHYCSEYRKKKGLERYYHVREVFKLCYFIVNSQDEVSVNMDVLFASAILHDIAKPEYGLLHRVPLFASMSCEDADLKKAYSDKLEDIIFYHSGKKFKPKKYPLEASILRMCDKIDKFRTGKERKAAKQCMKSFKIIKKRFRKKNQLENLNDFKLIFNDFMWQVKKDYRTEKPTNKFAIHS